VTVKLVPAWPPLDHLQRLTDGHGLFEHALFDVPRPEHGYCVDDVARGLVVLCREPAMGPELRRMSRVYLTFLLSAVQADGTCHNRMDRAGTWTDSPSLGDWWGRALWALGVAAVHAPTTAMRTQALRGFRTGAAARSPHLRARVFAALGAGELLLASPDEGLARTLLQDLVDAVGPASDDAAWPWPEPRLSYGNGSVVEALLLAGTVLPDADALAHALVLLDFLLRTESRDGHLSVTPVIGRGRHDTVASFDQQPIEVAALADACARAFTITGDPRWERGVVAAWAWFLGDNDSSTRMFDPLTGGGFDGLEPHGANQNQGAESTLAMLSTAQHAQRLEQRL
jgi:hypothetical protein